MSEAVALAPAPFDAETLPGERFELHPRIRTLWRLQSFVLAASITVPGLIPAIVLAGTYGILLAALVATAIVLFSASYRRRYLETFRCVLLPDGLLLERGVVWRKETFVPRPRIQHTDVDEGPIARHFGIATLKIFTAGTQIGQLEVDGLPRADALVLRDRLLGRDGHDAV